MTEDALKVWNILAKRLPDPPFDPSDIFNVVAYCDAQAWLNQRPLTSIPDTQDQAYSSGKVRVSVNPELIAWLKVARHVAFMQRMLFKKRNNAPPPPEEDDEDADDILTAADFPGSIRESAREAELLLQGKDISKTMPFALRIGGKAPGR
jgi:hypothetical protein